MVWEGHDHVNITLLYFDIPVTEALSYCHSGFTNSVPLENLLNPNQHFQFKIDGDKFLASF